MSGHPKNDSSECYGLGQSGYTAGRVEGDRALRLEGRNTSYPRGTDERVLALGLDERFTGCGGSPWVPRSLEDDKNTRKRNLH